MSWLNRAFVIAVVNLKGGAGKTTSAIYLALAGAQRGMMATIADMNPDGGAAEWIQHSPKVGLIPQVLVAEVPSERLLTAYLDMPSAPGELIVIDTPPNSDRFAREAMMRADAIVIPTKVGGPEPQRVLATLGLAPEGKPRGIIVTDARSGTLALGETIRGWEKAHENVWGIVPQRVGIAAGQDGPPHEDGITAYDAILSRALSTVEVN